MLQEVIEHTSDDHPELLAGTAMEVSHLHGLLATLFRMEITAELLQSLREPELAETLREAGFDLTELEATDVPDHVVLESLATEFAALFLGPGEHISPHESVHSGRSDRPGLWGEETVQVRRFVKALGYDYEADYHGLPDHISVELELMATLARHEAEALHRGDLAAAVNALDFQDEFMREHLLTWVPGFCTKVAEHAQSAFYRSLARLTREFLVEEAEEVGRRRRILAESTPLD